MHPIRQEVDALVLARVQWRWAQLKRDFQSLVDGGSRTAQRLGQDLLRDANRGALC
ncbi:MAG: hypothetical protein JNL18_02985 [Planctomycetaceae bacterium]|nr:hypothetical protein [Planctomycetaceae bacterium]